VTNNKKEINKKINMLYRQLGKEIYDSKREYIKIKDYKHILNKIEKNIDRLESMFNEINIKFEGGEQIIIKPEANENGIFLYKFCKKCNAGNNPESTHCIRCKAKL
jgi:ribosomal protein L40E